ncbi:class I histocompatibility antigen, F10 alpha chain-like isoform X3 [Podarcis raffonei]|uniref:class I histocompatibility antigen, F10 alpha chain-like isoform X2 n=1 Tax=Podarcis raffonei TaxID=65483 RepID=UPI0023291F87|nr:class I histocompatibility antigen, F10 alpha chain-like isoform X2 [Podarcis raffonei]XP_053235875.1 class I histocompatibility antigen, F10 alpha chain-like isoform X3 [Podarcis raffonei]
MFSPRPIPARSAAGSAGGAESGSQSRREKDVAGVRGGKGASFWGEMGVLLLRWPPLILGAAAHLLLLLDCAGSTSHSLRYFHTAVSEPGQGLPQFIDVGYVDDQPFVQYDSDTKKYLPRVPWIRKVEKEDPQYWHRNTQTLQGAELVFRENLEIARNRYNQSGGIHIIQYMYGCELRSDGRKGGHWQYSYDGRDFIAFDKETLTWTAADTGAQVTKRKWDPDLARNQGMKHYLEEECIEWLQRYLEYGKETLLRTEAPVVKVTRKADYDGLETLVCQVHGFYPKEIEANWVKDGEVWQEGTLRGLVAPNSDGTYYLLLSVQIDPEERERFRCRVEHDSLEKPLDVAWEKEPVNLWLIVGAILVAVVLLVAGISGIIFFFIRRKRNEKLAYKAASTSDQGSDSSAKVGV